ncbi:MAG: DUF948 domain-containing protein [Gemmatimonadota bacterium]|nr:DUF948 domain-containing protein [Gemmatimonadota bacterium]
MTALMSSAGALLLQAARALPDTIVTKQVTTDPGMLGRITSIATVVLTFTFIALSAALIPAAWNFRKSYKKISNMLDKVYGDVNPIMRHASTIADNVDYISTSVRVDIQQLSKTIAAANQSMLGAVKAAEARINQLNALLEVAQEEAESAFIATASTLRGVRTGINQAFEGEDLEDGYYSEDGTDDDEEPRPRIKPREGSGRGA